MLLSIGMIVKNEEKNLERLMQSLLPLNGKIDYEIVIVDTGSTDKTKEVAYKYTDKVYDFEWINDFSAARNYGLKKCTGKWFMFLDADEEMIDCQPLIEFLLNEENDIYNTVTFQINNFKNKELTAVHMSIIPKLFKNEDLEFKNKIHEVIYFKEPGYASEIKLNHYGYIDNQKKVERNEEIIDMELKEKPNDLRLLSYKCESHTAHNEFKEAIAIYEKVKNREFGDDGDIASYVKIVKYIIQIYIETSEIKKAKELLAKMQTMFKPFEVVMLDFYYFFIQYWNKFDVHCEELKDSDIAVYAKKYQSIYNNYHDNKYDSYSTALFTPLYTNKDHLLMVQLVLIKHFYTTGKIEDMYEVLDSFNLEKDKNLFIEYSDILYYLMKNKINFDDLKWLKNVKAHNLYISHLISNHPDISQVVLNYFKHIEDVSSVYVLGFYCTLLYDVLAINRNLEDEDYEYLLNKFIFWNMGYARYLYNVELFTEENVDFLPKDIQYCYYLENAIVLMNKQNYKEAIAYIRLAMNIDNNLVRGCKLLLPKVEEKKDTEFDEYAKKIKNIIIGLINTGKRNDAHAIYQQYKKVNPKDTELDKYFELN